MGIAFRKVWRDLWNNKGRTLLVVLSIGVGVLTVGMITASNTLIIRQMTLSQVASQPSNVILYLGGEIDDATVKSFGRLPGVSGAQGVAMLGPRWKVNLGDPWQSGSIIALADYRHQPFDIVELRSGQWPGNGTVDVEWDQAAPYEVPPAGGKVYFEVNSQPKAITIGGTVRDPQQFPPPFGNNVTFYATRSELVLLGGSGNYSQLKLGVPNYSKARAQQIADVAEQRLKKLGLTVGFVQYQDPTRHPIQDIMDGVALVLVVMAIMSMLLSTILVINTINAVIAQQIPQIGIMKTIGGLSPRITTIYLSGVLVYGLLSLALAVPLGALGANAMSHWMLGILNVPAAPFEVLQSPLLYQVGAGLVTPLLAGFYPVLQGVSISVREALNAYGVGQGRYGLRLIDRLVSRLQSLPRIALLALRNTFRRPGRVALTQVTLVTAGAVFMMVISTHYSFNETILQIFRGFGYDVIVGFNQPQRIDKIIPMIEARPGVERVEMWNFFSGKARRPGQSSGAGSDFDINLRAIPPDTQLFTPVLNAGRNLVPADGHALLLNQKLAHDMGVGLGDTIVIDLADLGKSNWTIVGLLFDLAGRNQDTAYLYRDVLNEDINQVGRASVAEIRGSVKTLEAQTAIEQDLRSYFQAQHIDVGSSATAIKDQQQANAQFSILTTLLLIMTFLIAVVGSFGLSGTLSINVLERRREIGVMRAVGASSGDVALIFIGEAMLLGLISWATAVPISLLAGRYFVEALGTVINFPAVYHYSLTGLWVWLAIVFTLSLLASWLPARRATRISVRESLAYE
jgi:putative ABC transport system permease protein